MFWWLNFDCMEQFYAHTSMELFLTYICRSPCCTSTSTLQRDLGEYYLLLLPNYRSKLMRVCFRPSLTPNSCKRTQSLSWKKVVKIRNSANRSYHLTWSARTAENDKRRETNCCDSSPDRFIIDFNRYKTLTLCGN